MTIDELVAENQLIRRTLSGLESRLSSIESHLQNNRPADRFDFTKLRAKVSEITHDIFPGKCEFTVECDPEYPDDTYIVVNVEATGDPKEIILLSERWHARVQELSDECFDNIRLSIVPR